MAGAAAAIAAAGWMVASCSLIYDLSTEQCSTDVDCTSRGGVFADMVCRQNVCEIPTIVEGCTSNAQCIDEPGFGGELRACIERDCVPVTSTECPLLLPLDQLGIDNLRTANPLILGAYAEIPTEQTGVQILNYNLALTEVEQEIGGLAGANGTRRSVVMVVCDGNQVDRSALDSSLKHLTDLRVPGVVSGLYGDDLQYVFENGGRQAGIFFVSPLEADPVLARLLDDNLVWHLLPSADYIARAYAPLLDRTLAHLDVTGGPVRVASIVANDLRLLGDIMNAVQQPDIGIKFNAGKTVDDNIADDNYRSYGIQETNPEASYTTQVADILTFKPHVIIAAAYEGFLERMVPIIERDWPEGVGEPPRPFYLLSPLHYRNGKLELLLDEHPELRERLVGVGAAAAEDPSLYRAYLTRWDEAYTERRGQAAGLENFYDAPYYLIYSAIAAGSAVNTGAGFASGMQRLLQGERYDVGPDDLRSAPGALSAPQSRIQLYGTMGPPDFDLITGTRASVGSAWCVDAGGNTLADVLRYREASGRMEGDMESCIPGF